MEWHRLITHGVLTPAAVTPARHRGRTHDAWSFRYLYVQTRHFFPYNMRLPYTLVTGVGRTLLLLLLPAPTMSPCALATDPVDRSDVHQQIVSSYKGASRPYLHTLSPLVALAFTE
jgi:hypothetical protein